MNETVRNGSDKDILELPDEVVQAKPFLNDFSRFLDAKLHSGVNAHAESSGSATNPSEVVSSLMAMRLRRNKMVENNSESRFNRLLKDFKQLDTYVDIRSFIKEMNAVNQGLQQPQPQKSSTDQKDTAAEPYNLTSYQSLGMNTSESNFKGLLEKVNSHFSAEVRKRLERSTDSLGLLINDINQKSRKVMRNLDEPQFFIDYEEILKKPIPDPPVNDGEGGQEGTYGKEKFTRKYFQSMDQLISCHRDSPLRSDQIDEKYEKDYNNKINSIQSKLYRTLASMHHRKWEKPKKHKTQANEGESVARKKPLLSEKYRMHAPKNKFEFRESRSLKKENITKSRVYEHCLHTQPCEKASPEKTFINSSIVSTTVRKRHLKNSIKTHRRQLTLEPTRSHQQFLKEINTVKQNYNFKKPLIKQTILRKLVDFIQKVETRQFDFRKENVELMASMNRYEQSKRVEFDKFLDEKLEIDAVEVKCIAERFRSRA